MKIDGGCLCGSISFEAEIDPEQVFVCHCTDCQTQSGSTFRTIVRARSDTFKLTDGSVKQYVKHAESGSPCSLAFLARPAGRTSEDRSSTHRSFSGSLMEVELSPVRGSVGAIEGESP